VRQVVIDASVALKWFLMDEKDSRSALRLLEQYLANSVDFLAPSLLEYEVINGLLMAGRRGRIKNEKIADALEAFLDLGLKFIPLSFYFEKALDYAESYNISAYDSSYLALAAEAKAPLITADERLLKTLKNEFAWLRPLTETHFKEEE